LSIEIREVKSKKELKSFIKFPFELYKNNPYWVPPFYFDEMNVLNPVKNPASEYCDSKLWLAYDNNKIVGRIAGIINKRYIEKWGKKAVRFGWIDFINDKDVSGILIETVIQWAKSRNLEFIHGPLGFTDLDYEGMLIDGFNEVGTMSTIYNYEYYPRHLENLGFDKEVDWVEFEITVPEEIPEKAVRVANIVKEKLKLKVFDAKKAKDFKPYGNGVFQLINDSYKDLFGFVPLSKKQIDKYIKQYLGFVVPDFLIIILDSENKVAGFVIAMPSLTKALQKTKGKLFPFGFIHILKAIKKNRYLDLYLGAIRPDLQGKGADALLMTELTRACIKNKIVTAESNIELESNVLVQGHWKYFNSRQHKRRRCFIKRIN
jgi:ribosomal protein S18 acetylase RimI-like enzyme